MISEIARVRHEKRDDGDTKGGRGIKKRKIKGIGQGVRRTGPTAQEQPHSRGFLQDSGRPNQHPLWNILLRSHVTTARFVLKIILPITSSLRENYFRQNRYGTLATRNWSMSVSRIRRARSMGAKSNEPVRMCATRVRMQLRYC